MWKDKAHYFVAKTTMFRFKRVIFFIYITTVFFLLFAESLLWLWVRSREWTGEDRWWSWSWYANVLIRSHARVHLHINLMHIFHTIDLLFFYEQPDETIHNIIYLYCFALWHVWLHCPGPIIIVLSINKNFKPGYEYFTANTY